MALHLPHFPLSHSSSASSSSSFEHNYKAPRFRRLPLPSYASRNRRTVACVGKEETQLRQSSSTQDEQPDAQDLEYVRQIQRVLELLKKNRDMIFNEVKLTVMIEDPRDVERKRLLGIDEDDAPTRDDLAATLEEVNEGKFPKDRVALRMLAEEMTNWPNLEVEVNKKKRSKSLYEKATDTGVNPREAAKRLNIDWDTAAEIEDADLSDNPEVPAALGYGALYLVTAFPVIIGLILHSNQPDHYSHYCMTTMTLPPSDTLVRLSVGTPSRRYEVVEDVVIEVSTQFKFPNSSPRLGSGVGAKKKVDEGGRGLKRCKSCGEGRGNAPAHGVAVGEVGEKGLNKHKERKARRCGGQLIRCGALCLLLPALPDFRFRIGKGKGKGKGKEEAKVEAEAGGCNSIISISISRRVSLEKFECGSWASSGMVVHNHDYEDGESGTGSLYFDLPMELIRNSGAGVQTQSPVKAAFVFDKDRKGVHHLPVWSKAKSTEESGSSGIASPCIISPRLRKAREEFNELLEAHAYTL